MMTVDLDLTPFDNIEIEISTRIKNDRVKNLFLDPSARHLVRP
jgi:hypothetical protein